jgi:S-adenosylmethionine/arginine decarboxylase-like enzyme
MIQHKHVIIRAEVNKPPGKDDIKKAKKWFRKLVKSLDMKILDGPRVKYVDLAGNKGLTGICIIETSHIAMHIWDEEIPALVQLDVYTCGVMKLDTVFKMLGEFEPTKIEYKYLDREYGLKVLDSGTKDV